MKGRGRAPWGGGVGLQPLRWPSPGDARPTAALCSPAVPRRMLKHFLPTTGFNGGDVFTAIITQSSISLLLKPTPLLVADLEPTATQISQVPIHLCWVPDNIHKTRGNSSPISLSPCGLCFAQLIRGTRAAHGALLQLLHSGLLGGNQLQFPLRVKHFAAVSSGELCSSAPQGEEERGGRVKTLPLKNAGASILVIENPLLKMMNAFSCYVAVSFQN